MAYDFNSLKLRLKEVESWLGTELSGLRTGRATPVLLDNVLVESYGSRQAIKHVASIAIEDPRTLKINPWDHSMIKNIESAIAAANLGVSTSPDSSGVRVIFPELTVERRQSLLKIVGTKLEEARISVRKERDKYWSDIQDKERSGEISEDDKFKNKDILQKEIDQCNANLEGLANKKEQELTS